MPLTTLSCSAQPHDPEPPVIRVRCSSTELQLQPLCACRLRGTVALVAALPKPARGLGHSVTIHMAGEIACADLGDKVPALAGMSFVQWGEDVPPPLSPATGIDGPWLARLGLRSEEHTSELQSLMRISYAVFCLKKKKQRNGRDACKILTQRDHGGGF